MTQGEALEASKSTTKRVKFLEVDADGHTYNGTYRRGQFHGLYTKVLGQITTWRYYWFWMGTLRFTLTFRWIHPGDVVSSSRKDDE